jgi:antitoxin VapB
MTNSRTTLDVIVPHRPTNWDGVLAALREADVPADFLDHTERDQAAQDRDPFGEWHE